MPPEVTVILPFFNAAPTLSRAIESILKQTFAGFELLLIDNNSTDGSRAIAQGYARKDARAFLLTEKKQGVAHAMNCGMSKARGRFLARMDADDHSHPERLRKQVGFLKENPCIGLVGSSVKYVPCQKNTEGFRRFVAWSNSFHAPAEIGMKRFIEIPVVNPTILMSKKIYEQLGGCLQGDFPEDYEMQLRYLEAGIKMAKLKVPLLEWHDTPNRLTRTDDRYSSEAFFRIKATYFKKWSEKNNPFHPVIWIWGAGRKTRQRSRLLENEGLIIRGFIDIVENKTSRKNTLHYSRVPPPGALFIVPMVTKPGARQKIGNFLEYKGYREGADYILMG